MKEIRASAGLTQRQMALATGRSVSQVQRSEKSDTVAARHMRTLGMLPRAIQVLRQELPEPWQIKAWFLGHNPVLDNHVPLTIAAREPLAILAAAHAFVT